MKLYHYLVVGGLLLIAVTLTLGVAAQEPPPENPLGEPPTFLKDIYDAWVASPHADVAAEAFVHWDAEGEVPESCAKCHTTPGYQDYLGADGSAAGTVDVPAALGSVVNCDACHNSVASSLTAVTFPSGVELTNLDDSARCMNCHQGRASGLSVTNAIAEAGLTDMNTVSADLGFINIHYFAAAASLYGGEVHAGYEFEGKSYQLRSDHVEGYNTCADCHNPHTLEVKVADCAGCHEDVESVEDVRDIRMQGSLMDYDGDGDIEEGIAAEIETLQEILYSAIQTYASEIAGTPIVYDENSHPYFFIDTNANGEVDEGEAIRDNAYNAFTGNLLAATYNYQVTKKDPGNYVHNPKYHIEILFDSIEMLMSETGQTGEAETSRNDPGHFDATGEPFRHWDADGEVPGTCAKCHTAGGLPTFLHNGANIAVEPSNSLACSTCHDSVSEFTVYTVNEVKMPSGVTVTFGEEEASNICLNCHQGRESTVSVNNAIRGAGVGDDEVSEALRFRNPHYFAAGATLFGGEAQGAYQYEGKEYAGLNEHTRRVNTCTDCHDQHTLEVDVELCMDCHEDAEESEDYRVIRLEEDDDIDPVDYDGDGEAAEPIAGEIETLHTALMAAIQTYAAETIGTPIAYNGAAYPYWFVDANGNGMGDADEEQYASWTPSLLRAAYNYQYVAKDPGAFAHNNEYVLQVMYDSIEALGGADAVASYTRPPLRESDDD